MRGELPILMRCCFCLPLRRGLLFWGYFKLMVATILLYPMGFYFMFFLHLVIFGTYGLIVNIVLFFSIIVDLVFNLVLVIAGHLKNHKLYRAYYYYTIILTAITVCLWAVFYIIAFLNAQAHGVHYLHDFPHNPFMSSLIFSCVFTFAYLVLQAYIILLVRSEAVKLRNEGLFRFVNNATEGECTLNINVESDQTNNNIEELNA